MKRVLKAFHVALPTVLAVALLPACSSEPAVNITAAPKEAAKDAPKDNKPQASAGTPAAQAATKIKIWTQNRHDQVYMTDKIAKFNKENKDGIEIDYQMYTDNYIQTLDMAFATNDAPDIIQDGQNALKKYYPMGFAAPLDSYLKPEDKARYGPGAFVDNINMYDGKIYSMPLSGTTTRLIYNKGIFKKAGIAAPPKTLAELVDTAKTITDKLKGEGIYGYAQNFKSPASALQRSIDMIVTRDGGVEAGYDFATGKFDFASYKPVLQAYRDMFVKGAMFPGTESLDIDPLRTQFAAGKIGMYISWTHAEPGVYKDQFPTKEDWDVAPLPTADGTAKGSQMLQGGTGYFMNAKSKNLDKAWKVMQYLYSDDVEIGYHEAGYGSIMIPTVLQKAKQPDTIKQRPGLAFTDSDKLWPAIPLNVKPEGQDMYQVFVGYMLGAKEYSDLDKTLEDLKTRYNTAFDKAVADGSSKRIVYAGFDPKDPTKAMNK
ncbi:ABC transporter substrate-binding protein [Paenibacillus thalictri]|uniref:Extracellular solute-binding protein n=1 Tax=Paenibacillus thalictri TaxID=2527873 RepID=A0A4Q9DX18_9BACL|nr:extracellular solute-binding protein [Paenibacillus thalictri]TBL80570.1 extracellular solute-binding protein [Paenibacillus thalictri]